jgi:hypothetical protein
MYDRATLRACPFSTQTRGDRFFAYDDAPFARCELTAERMKRRAQGLERTDRPWNANAGPSRARAADFW